MNFGDSHLSRAGQVQLARGPARTRPTATAERYPFRRPADVILDALGRTGPDAYRPDLSVPDGRWHARCPVCGGWRSLLISESRRGGPVTLRCSNRCHEQRVGDALARPSPADDPAEKTWLVDTLARLLVAYAAFDRLQAKAAS